MGVGSGSVLMNISTGKNLDDGAYCSVLEHRLCCQVTDLVCFLQLQILVYA